MNPKSSPMETDLPEIVITPSSVNATDDQSSANGRNIELLDTESNDKFFFSNMLRSLIPKSRQIQINGIKKCRAESTNKPPKSTPEPLEKGTNKVKLKRGFQEELKKCPQPPLSSSSQVSSLPQDSPLWSPLTLPLFWPPTDLQNACFLPTGLWEASHSVLTNGQRLLGKVWRDVPLGPLLLRHPNQNPLELTSSTVSSSTQSILRKRMDRSSFRKRKLATGSRFRSHHSSAFSTPQKAFDHGRVTRDKDLIALDLSVSAVVHKGKTAPNVHYVMSNLRTIFKDIATDVRLSRKDGDGTPSQNQSASNQQEDKNTQTAGQYSPNCKKFSALIGLEIVVDYVKQTDHS